MKQSAFTILTPVVPSEVTPLTELLTRIGRDIQRNDVLQFATQPSVHYVSLSVISDAGAAPFLLFEGNVDGDVGDALRHLLQTQGTGIDQIYRSCVGFPPGGSAGALDDALVYLRSHDIGADAFYVAWPGWTVSDVRQEADLRRALEGMLDAVEDELRPLDVDEVHRRLAAAVREDPELRWAVAPHERPFLVRHGKQIVTAGTGVLAVAAVRLGASALGLGASSRQRGRARRVLGGTAVVAVAAVARLLGAEAADRRRDATRSPDWRTSYAEWTRRLPAIQDAEDQQLQNHMVSIIGIKPGVFRIALLRVVLLVVAAAARLTANRGSLSGIETIHFARWVVSPDRRQLIFLTNYDGSWERYLTDFIDRAATGLTAIWTNTDNQVGFPQTRFLVGRGARDEVRFKAFARSSMVPTLVWYSAYPDVSIASIANNMEIRRQLCSTPDAAVARGLAATILRSARP